MASRSRVAQEKLQALEKEAATFEEQLVQAAIFVGRDLDEIRRLCGEQESSEEEVLKVVYHGREEWLLRWLLKKLQAPKDDIPRRTPSSWWLLCYLLLNIPLINVAQILVERKFISILQLALEEADKRDAGPTKSDSSSTEQETTSKSSKKRKRSGEMVASSSTAEQTDLPDLMGAIVAAINFVVESTTISSSTVEQGRSSAFIAEYMKTGVRTSAEAAAKILGSWLSLCQKALPNNSKLTRKAETYLSPFVVIWNCHVAEESQYIKFSRHATKSLLGLLRTPHLSSPSWTAQLEALVARNIINPAKTANSIDSESDMLSSLTKISVIQDSGNAAILFDIAIRCTPPPGPRKRRKHQDDTWLARVFSELKSAMPNRPSNAVAVSSMLQAAIKHQVSIDLGVLREIVWEYGLPKESENWELVSTVLEQDGNVFLIPDEKELLKELLERITTVSSSYPGVHISNMIVKNVLVPLMREFSRARDLSGFINHWHEQLAAFEKKRKARSEDASDNANVFSAWEDEALQTELKALLEPSLTIPQIIQNLDWLQERVSDSPDSTCVLLEAIAGAISGDEHVVDAVGLRIYHIMFNNGAADKLVTRYRWRSWRIISRTLTWIEHWDIDKLSLMWEEGRKPFDTLSTKKRFKHLFKKGKDDNLETHEIFSFACAAFEVADVEKAGRLESSATKLLAELLKAFAHELKSVVTEASSGPVPEVRHSADMNRNWLYWSFTRCLLVEHPRALGVGMSVEDLNFEEMVENMFWLASNQFSNANDEPVMELPSAQKTYPDLWKFVLDSGSPVRQNKKLIRTFIDIMLKSVTNANNPLTKADSKNDFATCCLHLLSVDDFSKAQREQIMHLWREPETTVLDRDFLALKVKVMQHPAIYDGMKFKDLVKLGDALAKTDKLPGVSVQFDHLALLKELTRLIFDAAVLANADQARNKTYIIEAFEVIRKKVGTQSTKKPLNFAMIGIFEVALAAFHGKEMTLNDHDIVLRDDLEDLSTKFSVALVNQLKETLASDENEKQGPKELVVVSIVDSLSMLTIDAKLSSPLGGLIGQVVSQVGDELNARARLSTFLETHGNEAISGLSGQYGEVTSISGRELILQRARASTTSKDNQQKLALLQSMLTEVEDRQDSLHWSNDLSRLLAIRHIISAIQEEKGRKRETDTFGLAAAYTILAEHLPKVTEIREFCLVSETLLLMLKTKGHSMSQYNIDSTIGAITIFCSVQAPPLKSIHAGTIYTHLCNLLQTILMHHRLKLQGHTHLTQQAMQSLLRCLFTPTSPSTKSLPSSKLKFASPPPWLSPLSLTHTQKYTKLLLLISDPPLSTLSSGSSRTNPLVSLKDKAKRLSAQWTKFVLQEYIWLLLDMNLRIEGTMKEVLMRGWWGVLECMGEGGRDAMRGEMDSGARAVFRGLFEEWRRVGGGGRRET